jgi:hypothetical protein
MTLLAQHGHGKGAMIDTGLTTGALHGAIFGPTNEDPERLAAYLSKVQAEHPQSMRLVDPQVYVACLNEPKLGHLAEYPYFPERRPIDPARLNARQVIKIVDGTMSWQRDLAVSHLLTPTIHTRSFALDAWTKAALDLAQEACAWRASEDEERPLYLSIVVEQDALRSLADVRDFVDFVTGMDPSPQGIYLVVDRGDARYSQNIDGVVLKSLLWLTHVLAEVHHIKVIVGYTDLVGILLHAVGAEATACGWYHSLRQFSMQRFIPKDGGAQPIPRYSSGPLLESLQTTQLPILNDLTTRAGENGLRDIAASRSGLDDDIVRDPTAAVWPAGLSTQHHWTTLSRLVHHVQGKPGLTARIEEVERLLNNAARRWQALKSAGFMVNAPGAGSHVQVWQDAIRGFRAEIEL